MALQNRIKAFFPAVTFPEVIQDEDRGYRICCEKMNVFATYASADSWKNGKNSAWIKLSGALDTATFQLLDENDVELAYTIDPQAFPSEDFAFYGTVDWQEVLNAFGVGCYKIQITYEMAGMPEATLIWDEYSLQVWSIDAGFGTVIGYARVRNVFNLNQRIDGINFTGANVVDDIWFKGQIRKDQPNIEHENFIYGNRRIEKVRSEQLRTFALATDPYTDNFLKRFEDLHLLSGNEVLISDYNPHTNSYQIQDLPVSIEESCERVQIEPMSREESITQKFTDRTQNRRTHY